MAVTHVLALRTLELALSMAQHSKGSILRNVLLAVKLVNRSQGASMVTLTTELGVTERSVYRYINALSEAGYPVFYDQRVGRYLYTSRQWETPPELGTNDATLILYALYALSHRLNEGYNGLIGELADALYGLGANLGRARIDNIRNLVFASNTNQPSSIELSSLLTSVAIETESRIKVFDSLANGRGDGMIIVSPSLTYKDDWVIMDRSVRTDNQITLGDLTYARIME